MKIISKLLFAVFIMTAFSMQMKAQNTSAVNDNLSAKATVLTALTITKNIDVDFKNISATTPGIVRLDPTGVNHTNVGVGATTGKFTIIGNVGSSVLITYPGSITLTTSESNPLVYNLWVYGNIKDDQNAANGNSPLVSEGTTGNVVKSLDATTGKYFLYVGGAVGGAAGAPAPLSSQAPGTYTGTANFTVTYN